MTTATPLLRFSMKTNGVLTATADGYETATAIAAATGYELKYIYSALQRLQDRHMVRRVARGVFEPTDAGWRYLGGDE